MVKNKRGWIRIIEAFFAVTLIAAVLIIILNHQNASQSTTSSIPNYEIFIMRAIELNDTLRSEIINVSSSSLPLYWDNTTFPIDVKNAIIFLTPSSLNCQAQICNTNDTCNPYLTVNNNVYAQNALIFSNLSNYNPRQLKLFCWNSK